MRVTWLGHSTVLLETGGGTRLLTDPLLRARVGPLVRHAALPPHPGPVDAVLLSHLHHDHLDRPSLRTVDAPVIGPPGTSLAAPGDVVELPPGGSHSVGDAVVRAVEAVHDGRRWPHLRRRDDDAIGFVVEAGGRRVYFAGDTEVFPGMADLGPLDLALVPIWGWGPSVGVGHMDPGEAVEALTLLRPAVVVPIHFGTYLRFGLGTELLTDPLEAFVARAAERLPAIRLEVLEPGGAVDLR